MDILKTLTEKLKGFALFLPALLVAGIVIGKLVSYEEPQLAQHQPEVFAFKADSTELESIEEIKQGTFDLEDGLYQGSGQGFKGLITVAVEIENKTIANIWVLSNEADDEPFLERAKGVIESVIKEQSTKVDAVSGATYSSNGIIEALKNAFKAAKRGTSSSDKTETNSSSKPTASSAPQVSVAPGTYQDGTYSVTSLCSPNAMNAFKAYNLVMNVTIKNDKITKISGVEGTGSAYDSINDSFISRAVSGTSSQEGVVTQIINKGTLSGIDAVSEIQYKDGIYTGTAICEPDENEGFNEYDLDLQVTVSGNQITAITNLKGSGYHWDSFNQWFINMVANGLGGKGGVVDQIIQKNDTTGIDAVSGATCSSIAIVEACKQALELAK